MMKILNKTWPSMLLGTLLAVSVISCKPKVSDADLKAKVESVTASNPNVVVSVKEGVVTLSGTVASEEEKNSLAEAAKNADAKHVKSVINELTVETAPIVTSTDDADLTAKVVDATKDYPTVKAEVKGGIITVTGSIEQARVQPLKMALDALNPKKVDMSALTVK
ncbi:BON domain-containing protein [Sphingobacterium suaedae]|uniref:BON domain-containing protein n=1 Tax=Sphingobacterium suaedae TaxID=1686402 RepID=A0ABW5KBC0_9SPHI